MVALVHQEVEELQEAEVRHVDEVAASERLEVVALVHQEAASEGVVHLEVEEVALVVEVVDEVNSSL